MPWTDECVFCKKRIAPYPPGEINEHWLLHIILRHVPTWGGDYECGVLLRAHGKEIRELALKQKREKQDA